MFRIKKTMEIAGCHHLNLPYDSPCNRLHGHSWIVTTYCAASDDVVDRNNGMVVDFRTVKNLVHHVLDHQDLNTIPELKGMHPTAENLARWICSVVPNCYQVDVQESAGNVATYNDESVAWSE